MSLDTASALQILGYVVSVFIFLRAIPHTKMLRGIICMLLLPNVYEFTTISQANKKVKIVQVTIPISIGTSVSTIRQPNIVDIFSVGNN